MSCEKLKVVRAKMRIKDFKSDTYLNDYVQAVDSQNCHGNEYGYPGDPPD